MANTNPAPNMPRTGDNSSVRRTAAAIYATLCLLLVAVAIALFGFWLPARRQTGVVEASSAGRSSLPAVQVTTPLRVEESRAEWTGVVRPSAETTIQAPVGGSVLLLAAGVGSRVRAGQLLAEVGPNIAAAAPVPAPVAVAGIVPMADVATLQTDAARARAGVIQQRAAVAAAKAAVTTAQSRQTQAASSRAQAEAAISAAQTRETAQRSAVSQAQAQADKAQADDRRYQDLYRQGLVAGIDADRAHSAATTALADLASAKSQQEADAKSVSAAQHDLAASEALATSAKSDLAAAQKAVAAAERVLATDEAALRASSAALAAGRRQAALPTSAQPAAARPSHPRARPTESVVAPFGGIVTACDVVVGTTVGPGTRLFSLSRTDSVHIPLTVPASDTGAVRTGAAAAVTISELPGKTFSGKVVLRQLAQPRTSSRGAPAARTASPTGTGMAGSKQPGNPGTEPPRAPGPTAEVVLANPDLTIQPGMHAQARVALASPVATLRIPRTALLTDGIAADTTSAGHASQAVQVAVVEPGGALRLVPVRIGQTSGADVDVISGLNGTEQIVAHPSLALIQGVRVKAVPSAGQ